jgi:hypothetical protein
MLKWRQRRRRPHGEPAAHTHAESVPPSTNGSPAHLLNEPSAGDNKRTARGSERASERRESRQIIILVCSCCSYTKYRLQLLGALQELGQSYRWLINEPAELRRDDDSSPLNNLEYIHENKWEERDTSAGTSAGVGGG